MPKTTRNPNAANHFPTSGVVRIDAACIADAHAEHAPGSLVMRLTPAGAEILHAGPTSGLDSAPDLPAPDHTLALPGTTLIPGMVNAHTHLDLTHLGPIEHDPTQGLTPWLKRIVAGRVHEPDEIAAAVEQGIAKSLAGAVVAVGDIAGWTNLGPTLTPFDTLAQSPILGISYVEYFAIGPRERAAMDTMQAFVADHRARFDAQDPAFARLGLTPHAPYTVTRAAYDQTLDFAAVIPLTTHLAESLAENEFIARATGPKRDLLEAMGLWDDSAAAGIGTGAHPIAHLEPVLARTPWLVAHVNDADDAGIATLARTGASVAYCPRSSAYFGADTEFGPHRYRDMLVAGVNVCLGTDSIANLDTPDRISVLDDMRLLIERDALPARTALAMGTTHGARALGLDPAAFAFTPGSPLAGLAAIDAADTLDAALRRSGVPRLLLGGKMSGTAAI